MPDLWSTSPAPFDVGKMLLLTDGSVLARNSGTSLWWRLRPDRRGRYAEGEWTPTGAAANAPLQFASAVMKDGSVIVAGGRTGNNERQASDICAVERYDPGPETWRTVAAPDGWPAIGDAPSCVLPDGQFLLGSIRTADCVRWDPAGGTWAPAGQRKTAGLAAETWTLLPDGTVLSLSSVGGAGFQRFSGNAWLGDVPVPAAGTQDRGQAAGSAILLADGSVLVLGVDGAAATLAPDADPARLGRWRTAPAMPTDAGTALGAGQSPLCLLPDGRVLCAAGPAQSAAGARTGTVFVLYDPAGGGAWTGLASPPGDSPERDRTPPAYSLLLLPTGQVLVSDGTPVTRLLVPEPGAPARQTARIVTCPAEVRAGASFTVAGTVLNGLSQACSNGRGTGAATNYPLARLRTSYPYDRVEYWPTRDHSSMSVSTGQRIIETTVVVPAGAAAGVRMLSIVANGAASVETAVNVRQSGRSGTATRGAPSATETGPEAERSTFGEAQLFIRDLSEVRLLIDFISGRADKSLEGLRNVCTQDSDGRPLTSIDPQGVLQEICKISYPPEGDLTANAQQAAFMLMVKDKLNYLSQPARGLTVAFTSMFSGVALEYPRPSSWRPAPCKREFYFARGAYPNLENEARAFRRFYQCLPIFAVFLVCLIAYTNWDVSVTTTVMQQIASADADYAKLFTSEHGFLPTKKACSENATAPPDHGTGAASAQGGPDTKNAHDFACEQKEWALARQSVALANLQDLVLRNWLLRPVSFSVALFALSTGQNLGADAANTAAPAAQTGFQTGPKTGFKTGPKTGDASPGESELRSTPVEGFTFAVLNGLNSIVIPTAFGLLGTLAGLMRSISAKMRESILAPRDYQIARVAIFLGMAAGLSVGLFFNGADPGGGIGKTLGSTISVSAAGLSFLAGFGSEAFFTFLDGMLLRLLPPAQVLGSGAGNADPMPR